MSRNKYPEETVRLIIDESLKLFIQQGYEDTSIQDIIDHLGGLSRGAIYHHFKSKEEIFEAVCKKIGDDNCKYYAKIRDDENLTGLEKLKTMLAASTTNPTNDAIIAFKKRILHDPKFFMNHINEIFSDVAPNYVQPIIEAGIRDGSIQTEYPRELAEVIITMTNIWLNPLFVRMTLEEMKRKMELFRLLLKGINVDVIDQRMIDEYTKFAVRYLT